MKRLVGFAGILLASSAAAGEPGHNAMAHARRSARLARRPGVSSPPRSVEGGGGGYPFHLAERDGHQTGGMSWPVITVQPAGFAKLARATDRRRSWR